MFEIEANILELKSEFFLSFFWVFWWVFLWVFCGFFLYMWGVYDQWFGITERPAGARLNNNFPFYKIKTANTDNLDHQPSTIYRVRNKHN